MDTEQRPTYTGERYTQPVSDGTGEAEMTSTDAQIYIDNGGILTLVRDNVAWVADWYPGDREQAIEAAESWNSGEWEPNEQDGWTCVSTDWQAVLDAEYDRDQPVRTILLEDYIALLGDEVD